MPEKRVVVIADEYTSTAFRLVGADARIASSGEEARRLVQQLLEEEDVGVILVSSEFEDAVRDIVERVSAERTDKVVALLPTLKHPGKPVDMRRLLLQALGFGG